MAADLARLATTEDAGNALGDYGEGWTMAIELGVDVTLLVRNLQLSPAERIRLAGEHRAARIAIQSRPVLAHIIAELESLRRTEKLAALEQCVGELDGDGDAGRATAHAGG